MRGSVVLLGLLILTAGLSSAGDLEPPGSPAPTMKSLDEIPPTWSQILDSTDGDANGCNSTRFKCVMGGGAVLDLETGLVWDRTPSTGTSGWALSISFCEDWVVGNRGGWRLPKIEELSSLVDPSQSDPALPPGHPFNLSAQTEFWSSSTDHSLTSTAKAVNVAEGGTGSGGKGLSLNYWCVRGGPPNVFTSQPNS